MLAVKIAFTVVFAVTTLLALTILGHAQGPLDFISFGLGVFGLVLTWRLGRRWQGKKGGASKLVMVLAATAILPVRLAIEILREVLRT
jgi:hypothetical protein